MVVDSGTLSGPWQQGASTRQTSLPHKIGLYTEISIFFNGDKHIYKLSSFPYARKYRSLPESRERAAGPSAGNAGGQTLLCLLSWAGFWA